MKLSRKLGENARVILLSLGYLLEEAAAMWTFKTFLNQTEVTAAPVNHNKLEAIAV